MLKLMRKLDSFKTLTIIIFLLIMIACTIIITLLINTSKTLDGYIDTSYDLKKESYVKEVKRQINRYSTTMQVAALNPTIRQNIFRNDVMPSEMVELSSELIPVINATTYLLADQEYIDRYVFYGGLPTDGRYFVSQNEMQLQPWYQDFIDQQQSEFHTFVFDNVNSKYKFFMLRTINDFNTYKTGVSTGTSKCYEALWIDVNAFFAENESQDKDVRAYPYLFYEYTDKDSGAVYTSNKQYQEYAETVYQTYLSADKAEEKRSKQTNSQASFRIEEIAEMNASLVIIFPENPWPNFFVGNGLVLTILILMVVFLFALCMLLVFYFNFRRRINSVIKLLDNFDEDEPLKNYDNKNRNDEIGKIKQHAVKMQNRIKTLIEEEYKIKIQNVSAQYEALSANINPHFLYNTLNSIAVTATMEGAQDSREMILALSDLFRYSADMSKGQVKLSDELKNVKDYLYIQEIRYNHNFIFRMSIEEELMNAKVPKLILQPIVENCFKHGFSDNPATMEKQNEIIISAIHENEFLKIYIMDNGKGMDEENRRRVNTILKGEKPLQSEGQNTTELGINNVNKRIKLLYKEKCGLEISCVEEKYTCVKLQLIYEEFKGG
ncbi:sensor histidine kinase [Scatolibacter rhodanostii]|uniref:sensor histidine kinase n=1 Tax=Scatolibacter rhodanostii TaxID=2014781 RepID=UPI000C0763CE|nr:histidine kinase [Scatolibacter rhodanostii]